MLAEGSSPETAGRRGRGDAGHWHLRRGSPSLTALTFAAAAARAAWDTRRARGLLDEALAAADDPDTRVDITEHLLASGRVADAIELLEERLRKAPDDENAAAWRARKFTGT
jgi:tetratricopeptide (TPR) repeat protein